MSVFQHTDYKESVLAILDSMPKKGYGQFRKIAQHLNINSVIVSQIFKGDRDLTEEQAFDLADYFGFTDLETKYFLLMVQVQRAGTQRLKQHLKKEMSEIKEKAQDLKNRVSREKILTDEAKSIFYSHWYYSGIRLLTSIPSFDNADSIAEKLKLPRSTVVRTLEFLKEYQLVIEEKDKFKMGPRTTHLESTSPHIARHHANWRMQGISKMDSIQPNELFYSGPMALSEEAADWVRAQLVDLIQKVVVKVSDSESERLACLNIDWFDPTRK
jgi:uncharacterized protein (TIGR02147 family)